MVASIARMVTTTMSSTRVKPEKEMPFKKLFLEGWLGVGTPVGVCGIIVRIINSLLE
jgi:hypothetical protein